MYKKMTVKEWIAVPANPIQRDTERHLAKAFHLMTPSPSHAYVFAAELPDGKLLKLDGHTRALAWEREMVERPTTVFVATIPVKNKAEAERIYKNFDSKEALETVRDKMYGAFTRHNFQPNSGMLRAGNLTVALKNAYAVLNNVSPNTVGKRSPDDRKSGDAGDRLARTDVYVMVNEFSNELNELDGYNLRSGQYSGGVIAAFILSTRKYGKKIAPFWHAVFGGEGVKQGREMDYVQALVDLVSRRRGSHGSNATVDIMARALGAADHWLKDETTTRVPSPMDITDYLVEASQPATRLIKAADKAKLKEAA